MAQTITMPKLGQTVEEGTIVQWRKKEGDKVSKGDILFEIETDKAVLEVESFYEGTLLKVLVGDGQTAPVQAPVGFVGEPGEELPDVPAPTPVKKEQKPVAAAGAPAPEPAPSVSTHPPEHPAPPQQERREAAARPQAAVAAAAAPAQPPKSGERFKISPRARKLARESAIDPTALRGTGPGGRVIERDVKAYLEAMRHDARRVTPAALALAGQEGVDLLTLDGSGEGGRILVEDVRRAVAERPRPLSKMRQIIAERLTHSFTTTPHFFLTVSADMTDLLAYRAELKAKGAVYTVTDFILTAVVIALQEFPEVNSTTDGKTVRWHGKVHLGLAVALDQGLVVPVIRNADALTVAEIHDRAAALVDKARVGKLLPDEMTGSTFTVSNMGMLDVENFTAIINPGESAILAVSSTTKQPVVRNDRVEIRSMMKMTLSSDHRLVDGATAARFANSIKQKLEDVSLWNRLT